MNVAILQRGNRASKGVESGKGGRYRHDTCARPRVRCKRRDAGFQGRRRPSSTRCISFLPDGSTLRIGTVQPTLSPPSARSLASGIGALLLPSTCAGALEHQLQNLFAAVPIPFDSGRAALAAAMTVAMRATGRRVIVVPAFTSYSVAEAAVVAGARVRLCDISTRTLDFEPARLAATVDDDVAAVLLGNLYGYPSDDSVLDRLRGRGILVIDDAAQALGASRDSHQVGARGDLGVLSFGRGKCVTTGAGGALLIQDRALIPNLADLELAPGRRGFDALAKAIAIRAVASPAVFGLLSRLPGQHVGESPYAPPFTIAPVPSSVHGLAIDLADAVARQLRIRRRVAGRWQALLAGVRNIMPVLPSAGAVSTFLRFPVLARDRESRDALVAGLAATGFRFVLSYPTTLAGIPEFGAHIVNPGPTPGADRLVETLLALPCHERVTDRSMRRAATVIAASGMGRAASARPAAPLLSGRS